MYRLLTDYDAAHRKALTQLLFTRQTSVTKFLTPSIANAIHVSNIPASSSRASHTPQRSALREPRDLSGSRDQRDPWTILAVPEDPPLYAGRMGPASTTAPASLLPASVRVPMVLGAAAIHLSKPLEVTEDVDSTNSQSRSSSLAPMVTTRHDDSEVLILDSRSRKLASESSLPPIQPFVNRPLGYVLAVSVLPDCHRQGIGTSMLQNLQALHQCDLEAYVELTDLPILKFFAHYSTLVNGEAKYLKHLTSLNFPRIAWQKRWNSILHGEFVRFRLPYRTNHR